MHKNTWLEVELKPYKSRMITFSSVENKWFDRSESIHAASFTAAPKARCTAPRRRDQPAHDDCGQVGDARQRWRRHAVVGPERDGQRAEGGHAPTAFGPDHRRDAMLPQAETPKVAHLFCVRGGPTRANSSAGPSG